MTTTPKTMMDYSTKTMPSWCPGCGDFGILTAVKQAMAQMGSETHETVLIAGIGCGSLMPYWVKTYGMCTLHGRAIPVATGVKMANHKLKVLVNCGDGDGLGIGMGHFIHFFRRNIDMTIMIDNNGVYGLTKGQTAPTAKKGTKTSSTPFGSIEEYVNGLALALTMGATFVARGYAGDLPGLTAILKAAMEHKGSAIVDILQPCVTFNKVETYQFYNERVEKSDVMFKTREEAYQFVMTPQEKISTGVFFVEEKPTYEEELPQLKKGALVEHNIQSIDVGGFAVSRS